MRDAVVLDLPIAPLCQEDCLGLCPECGVNLNEVSQHSHDVIDPRWAALGALGDSTESATAEDEVRQVSPEDRTDREES